MKRLVLSAWALAIVGCGEPGSLSPRGSVAREIGSLTLLLVVVGGLVFLAVLVALVLAARDPNSPPDASRSRRLVIGGGIVLPVVVLVPLTVVMLLSGVRLGERQRLDGMEIEVIGHQFWWEVRYPDLGVVTANEIHIPVGTPVRMLLASEDVIHSLWVPSLAGKLDMIPGKLNQLDLDADEEGVYRGFCAEFCGLQHARMQFLVIAQNAEEFHEWAQSQAAPAEEPATEAAVKGREVFEAYGCASCHTVRGSGADGEVGPDLTHLASRRTLGAGVVENSRGNLAGWVVDPHGIKPGNLMPPTPLSGPELSDLLDYLAGLE